MSKQEEPSSFKTFFSTISAASARAKPQAEQWGRGIFSVSREREKALKSEAKVKRGLREHTLRTRALEGGGGDPGTRMTN